MLNIIQVVRIFGVNGGMERYVWELSYALADLGVQVHILCEQSDHSTVHKNIKVHYLNQVSAKPRWLAMLRFSSNVSSWIENNVDSNWIIHSHERTAVHHISTFHGPPFAHVYNKPWWKRASIRVAVWLYLERREFVVRLLNNGINRKNLRFNAIQFHLWHNENTRTSLKQNDILLQDAIDNDLQWCDNGINRYL